MTAPAAGTTPTINRILFAVDFEDCSERAAHYVRILTRLYGAQLWVAHVVPPPLGPDAVPLDPQPAITAAEQRMAEFLGMNGWEGLRPRTVILSGDLWTVLSSVQSKNSIDLLVAGTHGRNWFGQMVLGSAAEAMVRLADCPVLTVCPQVPADTASDAILRILFPVAAEEIPQSALHYAIALANDHKAQLVLLHVLHTARMPLDYPDEEDIDEYRYSQAITRMKTALAVAPELRRDPELLVDSGVPSDCVVEVAKKMAADLIVMPVKKAPAGSRTYAPWHTAYRIMSHATCPVLTIAK